MNSIRISAVLYFVAFVFVVAGCDIQQGMMGDNDSINITNWNWLQILISLVVGILIGLFVARRKN